MNIFEVGVNPVIAVIGGVITKKLKFIAEVISQYLNIFSVVFFIIFSVLMPSF